MSEETVKLPTYVDIPSEQLLPEIEKGIKEHMEKTMPVTIKEIKWTAEGLRVWIQTKK